MLNKMVDFVRLQEPVTRTLCPIIHFYFHCFGSTRPNEKRNGNVCETCINIQKQNKTKNLKESQRNRNQSIMQCTLERFTKQNAQYVNKYLWTCESDFRWAAFAVRDFSMYPNQALLCSLKSISISQV